MMEIKQNPLLQAKNRGDLSHEIQTLSEEALSVSNRVLTSGDIDQITFREERRKIFQDGVIRSLSSDDIDSEDIDRFVEVLVDVYRETILHTSSLYDLSDEVVFKPAEIKFEQLKERKRAVHELADLVDQAPATFSKPAAEIFALVLLGQKMAVYRSAYTDDDKDGDLQSDDGNTIGHQEIRLELQDRIAELAADHPEEFALYAGQLFTMIVERDDGRPGTETSQARRHFLELEDHPYVQNHLPLKPDSFP